MSVLFENCRQYVVDYLRTFQRHIRAKRMENLVRDFKLTEDTFVLDVGGTEDIWKLSPVRPRLVFFNQPRARQEVGNSGSVVLGDARHLPFADHPFDLVFSNSVIEHVGSKEDQALFASEIVRVGKQYWVETPNRRFPIEQHLWTPFVHWLPKHWQAKALSMFCVWAFIRHASPQERSFYLGHYLHSTRLLTASELLQLFPDAKIHTERILWLTKALIVYQPFENAHASAPDDKCYFTIRQRDDSCRSSNCSERRRGCSSSKEISEGSTQCQSKRAAG